MWILSEFLIRLDWIVWSGQGRPPAQMRRDELPDARCRWMDQPDRMFAAERPLQPHSSIGPAAAPPAIDGHGH